MNIYKRIIAIILSLILTFGICLTSCKKKNETLSNDSETVSDSESDEQTPTSETILIADKGTINFRITYYDGLDDEVKASIENLYTGLGKLSGGALPNMNTSSGQEYDASIPEILIGDTGYPESKEIMDNLGYGEWTVRFVGNKLVVTGFSKYALTAAVTEVIKNLKSGASDDGTISFSADMNVTKSDIAIANNLPHFVSSSYPMIADEGENTALAIASMSLEEYNSYITKLANEGYSHYTSNTIGDNKFSTHINDKYIIHAGYYAYEDAARVTIEEKKDLIALESENTWTKNDSVVTSLTLVGLGEDEDTGMSYCYQLADGSFIVIDGGFYEDSTQLYKYMRAKAPGENIIIAAWLITHNDLDHSQCFQMFNATYKNDVKVEQIIMNLPSPSSYSESGYDSDSTATLGAAKNIPDCKIIKAHTGQKFYIRNAIIEILSTIDSFLPQPLTNFNNSSMVFTVDVEGERSLYLGDISEDVAKILVPMYGDYLKSDTLQLAHHGKRNGYGRSMPNMIKLYSLVRPEVVFWPSSHEHYLDDSLDEAYQMSKFTWNLEALKSARECYIAGGYITVLELPYTMYSAYNYDPSVKRDPVFADTPSSTDSLTYNETCYDKTIDKVDWND